MLSGQIHVQSYTQVYFPLLKCTGNQLIENVKIIVCDQLVITSCGTELCDLQLQTTNKTT